MKAGHGDDGFSIGCLKFLKDPKSLFPVFGLHSPKSGIHAQRNTSTSCIGFLPIHRKQPANSRVTPCNYSKCWYTNTLGTFPFDIANT